MLDRPEDPQQHIVLDYHKSILAEYNPKMRIGQSLFSRFSKKYLTGTQVIPNIYVGAGALDGPHVTNLPEVNQNEAFYRRGIEGAAPYNCIRICEKGGSFDPPLWNDY